MILNDNKLNYSLNKQTSVKSIGETPKHSSLILDIISEPHLAQGLTLFTSCLINLLQY